MSYSKSSKYGFNIPEVIPDTVYHYTKYDTLEKIINSTSLKFSRRYELNDPWDCDIDIIDFSVSKKAFHKYVKNNKPKYVAKNDMRKIKNDKVNSIKSLRIEYLNRLNNIGVCCFSTRNDNRLCWGQYADKFQGVAIGFSPSIEISSRFIPFFVEYEKKPSTIKYFTNTDTASVGLVFQKKHQDWQNEDEFRIVSMEQSGLIKFEKKIIKEVIFGLNETSQRIQKVKSLLKKESFENITFKRVKKERLELQIETIDTLD